MQGCRNQLLLIVILILLLLMLISVDKYRVATNVLEPAPSRIT